MVPTVHSPSRMSRVSSRKVGKLARVEALLPVEPPVEQLAPPRIESLVQLGDEVERVRGQDCARPGNLAWLGHDPWPIDH